MLFTGRTHGRIVEPQGSGGFGWDAIFVPDGMEQPFGSLELAQKNEISHRARALAQFVAYAKEHHGKPAQVQPRRSLGAFSAQSRRSPDRSR